MGMAAGWRGLVGGLLIVAVAAGCESDGGDGGPAVPDTGDVDAAPGGEALAFGDGVGACPATVITARLAGQPGASAGATCFVAEVEAGRPVVWDLLQYTVEGGPIPARFAFDGETIVRTVDTTRDQFGGEIVSVDRCTGAQRPAPGSAEPVLLGCGPFSGPGFDWATVPA